MTLNRLKELIGKEIALSDWMEITQDRIDAFAECTEDRQWIHIDKEKAAHSPFGKTIAHGFLILSLLSYFNYQNDLFPETPKLAFNYGLNKVKFIKPVITGSKIRNRAVLEDVVERGKDKILVTIKNTIEIKGEEKPAMVAESLILVFL